MMSSFTHHYAIPNLYEFLSSEDILKYADNRTVAAATDLHSIFHAMEVNGYQQLFGTNWQYINDDRI